MEIKATEFAYDKSDADSVNLNIIKDIVADLDLDLGHD